MSLIYQDFIYLFLITINPQKWFGKRHIFFGTALPANHG